MNNKNTIMGRKISSQKTNQQQTKKQQLKTEDIDDSIKTRADLIEDLKKKKIQILEKMEMSPRSLLKLIAHESNILHQGQTTQGGDIHV